MRATRAFFVSFGIRSLKIALYGWTAILLFGAAWGAGWQKLFAWRAGRSLEGADAGRIGLFTFFSDLLNRTDSGPALLVSLAALLLLLFLPLTIFISAGVYGVLARGEKSSPANLFRASRENFAAFLLQTLVNLLAWAPAALLSALTLAAVLRVNERWHSESGLEAMLWVWAGVTLLLLGLASAVADFAKFFRLFTRRNSLVSFGQGLRFVFFRSGAVLQLLFLYLLVSLAVNAAFWMAFGSWPRLAGLPFGLLLLALQGAVLAKCFLKVVLIRAQLRLLKS
jgi:hypothetical protein